MKTRPSLLRIPSTVLFAALLASVATAHAGEIKVISLNVESGFLPDSDLETIAGQMERYSTVDLWGLSEVAVSGWEQRLTRAAEAGANAPFGSLLGSTSGDRLLILYNTARLQLLGHVELTELQEGSGGRAPLVAHFRENLSGREFFFMVNHLHRSDEGKRHRQAGGLNQWARHQTVPVIAVGDYNFDWDIQPGSGSQRDRGFDLMTADDVFAWVRPDFLVSTQCNPNYNSVLDFVFVAGDAKQWTRESTILELDPDYCVDTPQSTDHRPVEAVIVLPDAAPDAPVPEPVPLGGGAQLLAIVAALPNPAGSEEDHEALHLRNLSDHVISLEGWRIEDAASTEWRLSESDGEIAPGQTIVILRNRRPMALNNGGDTVSLFAPGALQPHHSVQYDRAAAGELVAFP